MVLLCEVGFNCCGINITVPLFIELIEIITMDSIAFGN